MSVKKKRTIGPCRGVTWLYYVVLLWSRDFFPPLYLDPRFRPLLLKFCYSIHTCRKIYDRKVQMIQYLECGALQFSSQSRRLDKRWSFLEDLNVRLTEAPGHEETHFVLRDRP